MSIKDNYSFTENQVLCSKRDWAWPVYYVDQRLGNYDCLWVLFVKVLKSVWNFSKSTQISVLIIRDNRRLKIISRSCFLFSISVFFQMFHQLFSASTSPWLTKCLCDFWLIQKCLPVDTLVPLTSLLCSSTINDLHTFIGVYDQSSSARFSLIASVFPSCSSLFRGFQFPTRSIDIVVLYLKSKS